MAQLVYAGDDSVHPMNLEIWLLSENYTVKSALSAVPTRIHPSHPSGSYTLTIDLDSVGHRASALKI